MDFNGMYNQQYGMGLLKMIRIFPVRTFPMMFLMAIS